MPELPCRDSSPVAALYNRRNKKTEANKAVEPTIIHVTNRAPSSTLRAMYDRGSLLSLGKKQTSTMVSAK